MNRRSTFAAYIFGALLVLTIAALAGYSRVSIQASPASPASRGTPVPVTYQPTEGLTPLPTTDYSVPLDLVMAMDGQPVPLARTCLNHALPRLVVDATISSTLPASHWNTPGGLRPSNLSMLNATPFTIVTPLHFSQMHIIVDGRKVPTTELVILGGRVGQVQIEVHSMYGLLVPNQRYLLFFGSGRTEGQLYVGAAFRVVGQNIVAQEKMIEQGQMTQPQVTMPLSQVEAQLRTNCR